MKALANVKIFKTRRKIKVRRYASVDKHFIYVDENVKIPFVGREKSVVQIWDHMIENIQFRKTNVSSNLIVLAQKKGSGKTEFLKRAFTPGPWQRIVDTNQKDYFPHYETIKKTTTLYLNTWNPNNVSFERACVESIIGCSVKMDIEEGKNTFCNLSENQLEEHDTERDNITFSQIVFLMSLHYRSELCIVMDDIDQLFEEQFSHYFNGSTDKEKCHELLDMIECIMNNTLLIISGEKTVHAITSKKFTSRIRLVVVRPFEYVSVKELVQSVQGFINTGNDEEYFIEKLIQYTSGIPVLVSRTLIELYHRGIQWDDSMFLQETPFSQKIKKLTDTEWNISESDYNVVGHIIHRAKLGIPFSQKECISMKNGESLNIVRALIESGFYFRGLKPVSIGLGVEKHHYRYIILLPTVRHQEKDYHELLRSYFNEKLGQKDYHILLNYLTPYFMITFIVKKFPEWISFKLTSTWDIPVTRLPSFNDVDIKNILLSHNFGIFISDIGEEIIVLEQQKMVYIFIYEVIKFDIVENAKRINAEMKNASECNIGKTLFLLINPAEKNPDNTLIGYGFPEGEYQVFFEHGYIEIVHLSPIEQMSQNNTDHSDILIVPKNMTLYYLTDKDNSLLFGDILNDHLKRLHRY